MRDVSSCEGRTSIAVETADREAAVDKRVDICISRGAAGAVNAGNESACMPLSMYLVMRMPCKYT